ncbi:hypothetical protein MMC18_007063 [Xylographa bjoerkii]|nr:hypothetical protein [Xylographa bjoerkii]
MTVKDQAILNSLTGSISNSLRDTMSPLDSSGSGDHSSSLTKKPVSTEDAPLLDKPVKGHGEAPAPPTVTQRAALLKVQQLSEDGSAGSKPKVLATIEMSKLVDKTLGGIRPLIGLSLKATQTFCYPDLSPASDDMLLATYLEHVVEDDIPQTTSEPPKAKAAGDGEAEEEPTKLKALPTQISRPKNHQILYCTAAEPAKAEKTNSLLSRPPFIVKVSEWVDGKLTVRGNLQSTKLGPGNAAQMTMKYLRPRIAAITNMSRSSRCHQFCTNSGEPVVDEGLSFADYLSLSDGEVIDKSDQNFVPVCYKLSDGLGPTIDLAKEKGKFAEGEMKLSEDLFTGEKKAKSPIVGSIKARDSGIDNSWSPKPGKDSKDRKKLSAAYLTEKEWAQVISNCGLMQGWIVDRKKNRIVRAPKAAFRLRFKPVDAGKDTIPDFVRNEKEVKAAEKQARDAKAARDARDAPTAATEDPNSSEADKVELPTGEPRQKTIQPVSEAKEDVGSRIRDESSSLIPAKSESKEADAKIDKPGSPSSAKKEKSEKTAAGKEPPHKLEPIKGKKDAASKDEDDDENDEDEDEDEDGDETPTGVQAWEGREAGVFPRFQVNDDSRIEITLAQAEFEESMARNDFSKSSTEASIADVMLEAADLEPTPELVAAVEQMYKSQNIKDLRQLHQDFGGRLQATKVMKQSSKTSEAEQKEQFKNSVGMQVSTPANIGGGFTHTTEKGKSASQSSSDLNSDERNVFEAVGGDTILAASPSDWAWTVADYTLWRVISREALITMADAISAIPGYAGVKGYFIRAVPVLSRYVELSSNRETKARLRVLNPTSQLSLASVHRDTGVAPSYYLGHVAGTAVTPRLLEINPRDFWGPLEERDPDKSLFGPRSYRAPVILGYDSNMVGRSAYGTQYDQDFVASMWNITVPFNETLRHNTIVTLTTTPIVLGIPQSENEIMVDNEGRLLTQPGAEANPVQQEGEAAPAIQPQPSPPQIESSPLLDIGKMIGSSIFLGPFGAASLIQQIVVKERMKVVPAIPIASKATAKPAAITVPATALVVFRNQQGVFLPAMSSLDEAQYWRILKKGGSAGQQISEGDEVRFSWCFADQSIGFRDFYNDVFGRRRSSSPPELGLSTLYLKAPWPRFESQKPGPGGALPAPNAMLMSPDTSDMGRMEIDTLAGKKTIATQDVSFRLDLVGHEGHGDVEDYMLQQVRQTNEPAPVKQVMQAAIQGRGPPMPGFGLLGGPFGLPLPGLLGNVAGGLEALIDGKSLDEAVDAATSSGMLGAGRALVEGKGAGGVADALTKDGPAGALRAVIEGRGLDGAFNGFTGGRSVDDVVGSVFRPPPVLELAAKAFFLDF